MKYFRNLRAWESMRNEEGKGDIYSWEAPPTLQKSSGRPPNPNVCMVLLYSSSKAVLYIQVLSNGYTIK